MQFSHGVAPREIIQQDFKLLDTRETLRTTWENEELILIQSVEGHAHEGHGAFRGHRFPNTDIDDICLALRLHPEAIKAARQQLIDEIVDYVERTIHGDTPTALQTGNNAPLLGINTLRFLRVEARDVLAGIYLGGLRDDTDIRKEVEQKTGRRIGGGRCYLVDKHVIHRLNLDGDQLAHGEFEERIAEFHRDGLIVGHEKAHEEGVTYQYIRHRKGPGESDDAAIVASGLLWGIGVAIGVFLADAIDTLEKYVLSYRDQDLELARRVESGYSSLQFGRDEVHRLIELAAEPEDEEKELPDSSLRHLLSIDRKHDLCAIESHILAVEGVKCPTIGLGHSRTSSSWFYDSIRKRVEELK